MVICPDCQFENPNTHKFCQKCGTSLTHKVCPECSAEVAFNTEKCPKCGADAGTIWLAIITQTASSAEDSQENSDGIHSQLSMGSYLDSEQRYQLLSPLVIPKAETNIDLEVRVLDCQPYQISPIEAALVNNSPEFLRSSVGATGISPIVQAYIDLQVDRDPGIPLIHDAWQQGNLQVVLIEDRSHDQPLLDLWQNEKTGSLQILHWCYQMAQMWSILEPVNSRQSLLELANLRLDEDQTLALKRLYLEPPISQFPEATPSPFTIKTLGRIWQALFRHSQRTQFGPVVKMLEDLELGSIETLDQLRSRLEEIATELETPAKETIDSPPEKQITAPTILQLDDELEEAGIKSDDMPTMVLSMQLNSLEDAGRSDVGRQRRHNEDNFGIQTQINKLEFAKSRVLKARGLYILCDGMGGHAGGEVASELAVKTLQEYFESTWTSGQLPTEDRLREAVYLANQAIYNINQQDSRSGVGRMGTTLVMLLMQDTQGAIVHVGDSRLYRLTRKRGLEQMTVDHEVGQREIERGVEATIAYARPDAYQLTQALGPRDEHWINPDVEFFDINEDTLLLLVSDGLSDNDLLEANWQTHVEPLLSSSANLEVGITNLIDLANQYNGHDNITAIVVRAKVRPNQEGYR